MLMQKDRLYTEPLRSAPVSEAPPARSIPSYVNATASYLACDWLRDSDGALIMAWSLEPREIKALPESRLTNPLGASLPAFAPIDRLAFSLQPETPMRALARHLAIAFLLAGTTLGTLACFLLEPSTPFF